MKAIKENRVLTVIQRHKGAKDFGQVGFHQQPFASYFTFPKPLPADVADRVIGIRYELLERPVASATSALKPSFGRKPAPPAKSSFTIVVQRAAAARLTLIVMAADKPSAGAEALKQAETMPFHPSQAEVNNKIVSIKNSPANGESD
ncbi:MAG: hypothetical protein ACREE6_00460 [Limisphaerales bacterium]